VLRRHAGGLGEIGQRPAHRPASSPDLSAEELAPERLAPVGPAARDVAAAGTTPDLADAGDLAHVSTQPSRGRGRQRLLLTADERSRPPTQLRAASSVVGDLGAGEEGDRAVRALAGDRLLGAARNVGGVPPVAAATDELQTLRKSTRLNS